MRPALAQPRRDQPTPQSKQGLLHEAHQLMKQRLEGVFGQNFRKEISQVVLCVTVLWDQNILVSEHFCPMLSGVNVLQSGLES